MDDILRQYFDISLDDTRKMGLDNLLYWEEADAWYAAHTDTGLNTVTLTGGERTDDGLLKLSYSGGCITLRPTPDGQSPQPFSSFPTSRRVDSDIGKGRAITLSLLSYWFTKSAQKERIPGISAQNPYIWR